MKKKRIHGRIIGGQAAKLGDFPWQVLVKPQSTKGGAGALLNDKWIITAAHVIYEEDVKNIILKMGVIFKNDTRAYRAVATRIFVHPDYKDDDTYKNDIALIKLQDKVPLNEHILGICLPTKEKRFQINHTEDGHNTGEVSGWGKTESSKPSKELLYVEVEVVDLAICNEAYRELNSVVTDNMFCAGKEGKDSCAGDSGGALVFEDTVTSKWFIGGIVSWGAKKCGTAGLYGVYTKVGNYLDWIENTIKNAD